MPLHVSSTCAHHYEVKIALHSLWYHHTYRWPSRASSWLLTEINILRCTVSRTSIFPDVQQSLGIFVIDFYALPLFAHFQRIINGKGRNLKLMEFSFCTHSFFMHEISKRKANWIGHILRKNCLLQRVIEGKIKGGIEVIGRRGRRRGKLLDDLKERRGDSHLKEEALDRTMWRARFGRGFGPVVRQTTKWMNDTFIFLYHGPMMIRVLRSKIFAI